MSEENDVLLVRRSLQGDAAAVQSLVDRYQSDVFGLCVRLLNHRHDAEDVSQEVFLRVFRSLKSWDSSRPLRPWIMAIAVNRCRTWMAQRAKRPEVVEYLQDTAAAPPDPDDARELIQEIQAALETLRTEYRTTFVLFHEQGMPYDEIAGVMKKPVGTIKTWLHRARLEIMSRLQKRGMVTEMHHEMR